MGETQLPALASRCWLCFGALKSYALLPWRHRFLVKSGGIGAVPQTIIMGRMWDSTGLWLYCTVRSHSLTDSLIQNFHFRANWILKSVLRFTVCSPVRACVLTIDHGLFIEAILFDWNLRGSSRSFKRSLTGQTIDFNNYAWRCSQSTLPQQFSESLNYDSCLINYR